MTSRMSATLAKEAQAKLAVPGPVTRMGLDDFKALVRQRSGVAK
jgi:hypothetical protein